MKLTSRTWRVYRGVDGDLWTVYLSMKSEKPVAAYKFLARIKRLNVFSFVDFVLKSEDWFEEHFRAKKTRLFILRHLRKFYMEPILDKRDRNFKRIARLRSIGMAQKITRRKPRKKVK